MKVRFKRVIEEFVEVDVPEGTDPIDLYLSDWSEWDWEEGESEGDGVTYEIISE